MKKTERTGLRTIVDRQSLINFIKILGLSIIVIIGTFPENSWTYFGQVSISLYHGLLIISSKPA